MKKALLLSSVLVILLCVSGCVTMEDGTRTFFGIPMPAIGEAVKDTTEVAGSLLGGPWGQGLTLLGVVVASLLGVKGGKGVIQKFRDSEKGKIL